MHEIKEAYGLSDLELTDIYNEYHKTRYSCPLRIIHIKGLKEALECRFRVVKR